MPEAGQKKVTETTDPYEHCPPIYLSSTRHPAWPRCTRFFPLTTIKVRPPDRNRIGNAMIELLK